MPETTERLPAMQYGRLSTDDQNLISQAAMIWGGGDGNRTRFLNEIVLPVCRAVKRARSQDKAKDVVEKVRRAVR